MFVRSPLRLTALCALALAGTFFAQDPQSPAPDSKTSHEAGKGLPLKPERKVEFATGEGTWMSVDVSPDGRTLLFDLDGHLFTLPIVGGSASAITSGIEISTLLHHSHVTCKIAHPPIPPLADTIVLPKPT